MFSILKSDLVNPFEPIGDQVRQELNQTISLTLNNIKSDTNFFDLEQFVTVSIIAEQDCVLCGAPWVDRVLETVNLVGHIEWYATEGARLLTGDKVCTIYGKAQNILGKEKIILDCLSLYSTIATQIRAYTDLLCDTKTIIYCDFIKIPRLVISQQYAVRVGGGQGFDEIDEDGILITLDQIHLLGGMASAMKKVLCQYSAGSIKVEVASLQELSEVIEFGIKTIKLCGFTLEQIAQAQKIVKGRAGIEVYRGVHLGNIKQIAKMGISKIILDGFDNQFSFIRYSYSYMAS